MRHSASAVAVAVATLAAGIARAEEPGLEVIAYGDAAHTTGDTDDFAARSRVDERTLRLPGIAAVDALATVPSLTIVRTGSAFDVTSVSLRGGTSAQTPVFLSGIPLNDEATGTADLALLPPFFLKSIDVYRGLAPIGDDPVGMSGAIHAEPELPRRTTVLARFGAGSYGRSTQAVGASFGDARSGATIAVRRIAATNDFTYLDDRGTRFVTEDDVERTRENADAEQLDVWILGRARLGDRGAMRFVVNGLRLDQGVSGLAVSPARDARGAKARGLAGVATHVRCGEQALDDGCVVEARAYGERTAVDIDDPRGELVFVGGGHATVETLRFGTEVAVRLVPVAPLRLRVGAGQSGARLSVVPRGVPARRSTSRVFGDAVVDVGGGVLLVGGAALASDRLSGPRAENHLLTNLRAGVSFAPAHWLDTSLVLARQARAPTLGEKFGLSDSLLGNPDLASEGAFAGELRVAAHTDPEVPALTTEIVGFSRFASDLIAYRRTSLGTYRPFNVASARVLGGEASATFVPVPAIAFGASGTIIDAQNPDAPTTEKALPLVARGSMSAFGRARTPAIAADTGIGALSTGVTFTFRSERPADPAGLIVLPSVVGLDADMALEIAGGLTTVGVRAQNLLDDRTTDLIGYPLPGRSIFVDVEGRWP